MGTEQADIFLGFVEAAVIEFLPVIQIGNTFNVNESKETIFLV